MTDADYRYTADPDEEINTPRALPRVTRVQAERLRVVIAGHSYAIWQLDAMQFYRMCKDALTGNPVAWRHLQVLFAGEVIDRYTKWYAVLELLRYGVVRVERGMLVKREREEVAA
jgi:hypothetical protein